MPPLHTYTRWVGGRGGISCGSHSHSMTARNAHRRAMRTGAHAHRVTATLLVDEAINGVLHRRGTNITPWHAPVGWAMYSTLYVAICGNTKCRYQAAGGRTSGPQCWIISHTQHMTIQLNVMCVDCMAGNHFLETRLRRRSPHLTGQDASYRPAAFLLVLRRRRRLVRRLRWRLPGHWNNAAS
jgi:hypothetical protein